MNAPFPPAATEIRRRLQFLSVVLLALASMALAPVTDPAEDPPRATAPAAIEDTRATLDRYVETRRVLSAERRDWALGQEVVGDRVAVLEREVQALRARIHEAKESIGDAESNAQELTVRRDQLKSSSDAMALHALALEQRLRTLLPRLPAPVVEQIKPLSQLLPAPQAQVHKALGARFLTVVGLLNELARLNGEMRLTSEVRELPDGRSAEVTVLYAGLGQAWYVTSNGRAAGFGSASPTGWIWSPADEAAQPLQTAIATLRDSAPAAWVGLPMRTQDSGDQP